MTSRGSAALCARLYATAHPAVVEHALDAHTVEAALRDDAAFTGTDPGRDFEAEAEALAVVLFEALTVPSLLARLDPAAAAEIADGYASAVAALAA